MTLRFVLHARGMTRYAIQYMVTTYDMKIAVIDLAKFYGTTASLVNLYRKRNADRLTDDCVFQ